MPEASDVQEAIARLEAYRRQIELASRNLELLQTLYSEASRARTTLEGWKDQPEGSDILLPIGSTTFVHAKVGRSDKVILGLGRSYAAERDTADAVAWILKREEELRTELERMTQSAVRLQAEADQLQDAIEAAMGQGARPEGA
jgi:prefoldin alpha subunit